MPRNLSSTDRYWVNRIFQHHDREVQNFHRALRVRVRDLLLLLPLQIAINLYNESRPYVKELPLWLYILLNSLDALCSIWYLGPLILDFISWILWCRGSRDATYWPVVYTRAFSMCLEMYLLYNPLLDATSILWWGSYYTISTSVYDNFFYREAAFTALRFTLAVKNFNNELQIFRRLGELERIRVILEGLDVVCRAPGWAFGKWSELLRTFVVYFHQCLEKYIKYVYKVRRSRISERLFLEACDTGDKVAMRSLLTEHGDSLNVNLVRNRNGDTGLHLACRGGHATIAESLLDVRKKVVNVNIENSRGETPLMIASSVGHTAIVKRLVKAKGLKLKDEYGEKSMLKAVENEHYETAKLVLTAIVSKEGVSVDARLRNVLDKLDRCLDLSKKVKTTKSQVERHQHSLSLDIYKRSIIEVIGPTESSCQAPKPSKKKSLKESLAELKEFLECSICFEEFENLKIFACINDHWICMKCLPQNESCPFCRVDFDKHPPSRRITSEKFLQILVDLKSDL